MSEKKKKDMPQEQPKPEETTPETPVEETPEVPEVEETFTVTRQQMEQFESLAKLVSDGNDKYLRLAAEYDNYRKRTAREHDEIYPNATANAVAQFLPALDAFERGMSVKCTDESFHKGMEMVQNQMKAALEKLGCTPYGAPGDPFDPALHNAIMRDEDGDDADTPVITEVFQPGYKLGDKVVRFAMVKVKG